MQGQALWARLSASHGYLNKQGYCDGGNTLGSPSGNCHLFPVIWGETGTGFTVSHPQQQAVWQHDHVLTASFDHARAVPILSELLASLHDRFLSLLLPSVESPNASHVKTDAHMSSRRCWQVNSTVG